MVAVHSPFGGLLDRFGGLRFLYRCRRQLPLRLHRESLRSVWNEHSSRNCFRICRVHRLGYTLQQTASVPYGRDSIRRTVGSTPRGKSNRWHEHSRTIGNHYDVDYSINLARGRPSNHGCTLSPRGKVVQQYSLKSRVCGRFDFVVSEIAVFGGPISLFLDLRQSFPISQETCVPTMQNTIELLALKPNIPQR